MRMWGCYSEYYQLIVITSIELSKYKSRNLLVDKEVRENLKSANGVKMIKMYFNLSKHNDIVDDR